LPTHQQMSIETASLNKKQLTQTLASNKIR
jgi:hypothetical protein